MALDATVPLKVARRMWWLARPAPNPNLGYDTRGTDLHGPAAADLLHDRVAAGAPLMIARWGANELRATMTYCARQGMFGTGGRVSRYFGGLLAHWNYDAGLRHDMHHQAGFFPARDELLDRFGARMLADLPEVDILGSWQRSERELHHLMPAATTIPLLDLEPYRLEGHRPWTAALEGRRVLVIHPFARSIERQYRERRRQIHADARTLPDFDLVTQEAVQTAGGGQSAYKTWFDALAFMEERMLQEPFDIALIGCGAYGFPLAAAAKRAGRQAAHLGGALQLFFGIRGTRWDKFPEIARLYNDAWTRPLPEEVPPKAVKVEGGAYW